MECPDGLKRRCFPLLCSHVCDHVEALKATLTKKNFCTACEATEGQLHYTGCPFPHKSSAKMQALYQELRDGILDDNDTILPGQEADFTRRESRFLGCRSPSYSALVHCNYTDTNTEADG